MGDVIDLAACLQQKNQSVSTTPLGPEIYPETAANVNQALEVFAGLVGEVPAVPRFVAAPLYDGIEPADHDPNEWQAGQNGLKLMEALFADEDTAHILYLAYYGFKGIFAGAIKSNGIFAHRLLGSVAHISPNGRGLVIKTQISRLASAFALAAALTPEELQKQNDVLFSVSLAETVGQYPIDQQVAAVGLVRALMTPATPDVISDYCGYFKPRRRPLPRRRPY